MDLLLPNVPIARISPSMLDATARFVSPLSGTVRTVGRPGDRWGFRLDFQNLYSLDRARLESFLAYLRGAANRALYSPGDYVQRGSFPSGELFTNNDFATGTSGWSAVGGGAIAAADRVVRLTLNGTPGQVGIRQGIANMTQNMPYVLRVVARDGSGVNLQSGRFQTYIEGTNVLPDVITAPGLTTISMVTDSALGSQFPFWNASFPVGALAGDSIDLLWTSISQCALVDNGPNLLEYSDTFASPWGATAASITTGATDPTGNTSGASLLDTTSNVGHFVEQSVSIVGGAVDCALVIALKAGAQSWADLQIEETTGGTSAFAYFNLSTGAVGNTGVGANWANLRTFSQPLGNGWYLCALVSRKTNAATTLNVIIQSASANGVPAYAGTGGTAIQMYRATAAQSSVPMRLTQTTSAAAAALAQSGSALYIKGLPASAAGLLLPGDWVQICNLASGTLELKRVTASLDSDAAQRGYLQFSPPMRTPPGDNDPIVVNKPMGRFIAKASENGWTTDPGYVATSSLELIEAA